MEAGTAAAKPKGRRRPAKKQAEAAAPPASAAAPPVSAAAAGTLEHTEQHEEEDAGGPRPSLSQRVAKSLRQLTSQLGAGSKTEDGGEVDQERRGEADAPASPQDERDQQQQQQGDSHAGEEGGCAKGGRVAAAARRLRALLPRSARLPRLPPLDRRSAAAAALALLLLAAVGAGARAWLRHAGAQSAQLAALEERLGSQAESSAAERAALLREVAQLERRVQQLGGQLEGSGATLAALQQSCGGQAAAAAGLEAQLAAARDDIAHLLLAAARASGAAGNATAGGTAGAEAPGGGRLREMVQEEVSAAVELLSADKTGGGPDYALAAVGAAVVAHSPTHQPPGPGAGGGALGALYSRLHSGGVHPQANKLLLGPVTQPGACLPLVGSAGWVDVRLAQPIHPTAFSYEHIPAAIAAPKALALVGFTGRPPPPTLASATAPEGGAAPPESGAAGPAAAAAQPGASLTHGGVPLGEFSYDMRGAHAVQTFQLSQVPPGLVVDHVRLLVRSNHGHPNFTCLYRLRMHGQPGSMPRAAAAATA